MPIPSPLLVRLVTTYKGEKIRHPQLKTATLAQWLLESSRGTTKLAAEHYNFGGLKWRPEMKPYATRVSYEAHDGMEYYCKFATLESFINGYWAFMNRSPYSGWEEHVQTGEEYMRYIGPTYCPDPGYVNKVLALIPEAEQLLNSVNAGTGSATPEIVLPTLPAGALSLGTIVLDPGHGGTTNLPGSSSNNATSATGVKEKKLTLEYALLLEQELVAKAAASGKSIRVILTRRTDDNIAGAARAAMAGSNQAKLFLSLHFNGSKDSKIRGTETFYEAKVNGNVNLAQDQAFAQVVQTATFTAIKELATGAKDRGIKPDTETQVKKLAVLDDGNLGNTQRPEKCRAALLEVEFITHPTVDRLLVSGADAQPNRRAVMRKLAEAIVNYLGA